MENKNFNIELTEQEEFYLKQYARLYDEEREMDCTYEPIVVVETKEYTKCDLDNFDLTKYLVDDEELLSFDTFDDLLNYFKDVLDIDLDDLSEEEKEDIELEFDLNDDFEFDGHKFQVLYLTTNYNPVAYFLTRHEAEIYMKNQLHNLCEPRVYTRNIGYRNYGDLNCLTKMLLRIGEKLNEDNENDK